MRKTTSYFIFYCYNYDFILRIERFIMKILEGKIALQGNERIAVLCSRFNSMVTERLIDGAKDCYLRHGGSEDNFTLIRVPGAFELPFVLEKVLENPQVIKTPVVRNGKQSTLGYQPDVWKTWK